MSDKPKFVLCPRCELNYIEESEGYCKVCKASMGLIDSSNLLPDEEELMGEKICPICKVNYISDDEEMCIECRKERDAKEQPEENVDDWHDDFVDEPDDESTEISLSELEEEEEDEDESYDDDKPVYDDFDYDVDEVDFDEEDEEEEEEEEEEEDDL